LPYHLPQRGQGGRGMAGRLGAAGLCGGRASGRIRLSNPAVRPGIGKEEPVNGNRRQRCLLFLTGQSITLFGSTLTQMAIIWYITAETGSGAWIGAFTAASYLPQFLVSLAGGAWADRWDRRRIIIGAD